MTPRTLTFEVCAESLEAVKDAVTAGADRVELCANLELDGTTPSFGMLELTLARTRGHAAVHVLVRPRGGDFTVDRFELETMLRDIAVCRRLSVAGVVIGALTESGEIDVETCRRLIAAADGLSVTFHRAFDAAAEPLRALDDVLALRVDRLLTSGGAASVTEGMSAIAELVRRVGDRLIVLPGGGVHEDNVAELVAATGVRELHFTGDALPRPNGSRSVRLARIMQAAKFGLAATGTHPAAGEPAR